MTNNHFLAINTVSGACSVAISSNSVLLKSKTIRAEKGFSEIMIPLIDTILRDSQLDINQLTGFLVCTGPGNYTSLRVAISATRGLSLACKKPSCGISLFELLSTHKTAVLALVKGPAEKLYVQKFSNGVEVTRPRLMTMSEIAKTEEFFYSEAVGYRAAQVGKLIGSTSYLESTEVSFEKIFSIGIQKLTENCPRPAPIYGR